MHEMRKRLLWVSISITLLFSLLILQFYKIQIIEGAKWINQAHKQHFFIVKEPFVRGSFFSNVDIKKGHPSIDQPLVMDVPRYHLFADPLSIPPEFHKEVIDFLVNKLDLSVQDRLNFHTHFEKKTRSRKLAMWLNKETHNTIQSWWKGYSKKNHIARNALFFIKDYQRSYPFGKLLGQVLHTIQGVKDEKTHQAIPTGGLELYFNKYLQGSQGKRRLMRSPSHSLETGEIISLPDNGADIYLTINHFLQTIAEEELEKGVKKCKAKGGWAIMLDPATGEILALAQYPFFVPSDYQRYFNDLHLIEHTKVKAITDANEPGSVFKPFIMAAGLQANKERKAKGLTEIFSPEAKVSTTNGHFPGRSKPIADTTLHPFLNMDMALWKSSNIYPARLVEKIVATMGNEWFREELQHYGFGVKTGIELPAESAGMLPTPGKTHPNGALEWSKPTPFSIAFGHNVQATSLQLARAYAIFANGGYLVKPTLVRKIVKKNSDGVEVVLLDNVQNRSFPRVMDEDIAKRVVKAMSYVTKPGGTAIKANIPGYTEAGKTSTAKKLINGAYSDRLYCSSFAGFTPVDKPAFVIVVTMDEPEYGYIPGVGKNHHGGNCTAGVFKEIGKRSLAYLGIPADDPYGYPNGDPRFDAAKARWLPETKQLQALYDSWNGKKK